VDICPVGALVSKDFLHKARAWDLDHKPTICPNCSQGCNIDFHVRDNRIQRLKPRANLDVNQYWMCDYGRHRYEWMNREDRIEAPLVREGEGHKATDWGRALEFLGKRLTQAEGPIRAVASPFASNEDLAGFRRLVDALGGGEISYRLPRADDEVPLPGGIWLPTPVEPRSWG
jgi:NADH-quinone oxidoreductase subunit G